MLEADSFDHSNSFRVPSTINEISDPEINEVTQGHWNNNGNYDNKCSGKNVDKNHNYKRKRTLTRNHGKTRIKSCGIKIIKHSMVTRSPSPRTLASQSLKMLSIFVPQGLMKEYLMQ